MPTVQLDDGPAITWTDSDYKIVSTERKKSIFGKDEWKIRYTKGRSGSIANITIKEKSRSGSWGGGWKIRW